MAAALAMLAMMLAQQGVVILQEQVAYQAALDLEAVPLVFLLITQRSVAEIAPAVARGVPLSALRMAVVLIRAWELVLLQRRSVAIAVWISIAIHSIAAIAKHYVPQGFVSRGNVSAAVLAMEPRFA